MYTSITLGSHHFTGERVRHAIPCCGRVPQSCRNRNTYVASIEVCVRSVIRGVASWSVLHQAPVSSSRVRSPVRQAASLYERAVNVEETAERHVMLAKTLILAQRRSESLGHYVRAADLYEDSPDKARQVPTSV